MTLTEKLLKRLPKKYHDRVEKLEEDIGLVDDCKYMLWFTENYCDGEACGSCFPVRSISEAVYFIKNSIYPVRRLSFHGQEYRVSQEKNENVTIFVYRPDGRLKVFTGDNLIEACKKYEDYRNMQGYDLGEFDRAFKEYCLSNNIILDDGDKYDELYDKWYDKLSGSDLFHYISHGDEADYVIWQN